jgi:ubiquinone/menaquinone biosynthesis C-methylase UbiE
MEKIPNVVYKLMSFSMKIIDKLKGYSDKNFDTLGIKAGQTVIDYGCGPARYIENASKAVAETGKVIAVDIHPLAVRDAKRKAEVLGLKNVEVMLAIGYEAPIQSGIADVVYALDMFHMIEKTDLFLKELSRLAKDDGLIIIEDGHQSREETKKKILASGFLKIIEETKSHVKCGKIVVSDQSAAADQ